VSGRLFSPARHKPAILAVTVGAALLLAGCGRIGTNAPAVIVPDGDPLVGRALLDEYACVTCHVIPGVRGPEASLGPPLTDWAEREYIAGKLANTPQNLIAWIVNPQAIEPGTVMPTLGVTPEEARDIAAYLYAPQGGVLAGIED
jgi:cytochrome c2